jgi:GT2 family glycosyltransferase
MSYLSKVTAVLVLYNVTEVIFDCLNNLKNIKIIIVDNGNNNLNIINKIKNEYLLEKYFKTKKNIGFGRANNFGFKYVKTQYTLLIEPDVIINESNIVNLIKTLETYPNAGVVVPRVADLNNEAESFLDDFEENRKIVRNNFESKISNQLSVKPIVGDVCINFSIACILLVNNNVIKKIGLFNKKYFIYWEDFELFRRLKLNKIPAIKSYSSIAKHLLRRSTNVNLVSQFIMETHILKSSYLYFNVEKKGAFIFRKTFLYFFRFITYLLILNKKKILKNLARLYAIYLYLKKN